jgi:phenylpropionate dioxygenase-like ring-hydroxylating dioxygenase large terminal subunit
MIYNKWYAVLPSKAVKKGGVLAVKRLNLNLALFRTKDGTLGCLVDQCTHRGAALSLGELSGGCLRCPFHALHFDARGKCVFIPANGKSSTEDYTRYNVKAYTVREAHGIIYLWYGDLGMETEALPFFDDQLDDSYAMSELADHWNTHYSRAIENQLDVVHVPVVHYNTIGRGCKTLINGPKHFYENGTLVTSANNESDNGQTPKPPGECEIKSTYLSFKFPNVWLNHIADKIKVMIYFAPVDDANTILYIRFYCKATGFKPLDAFIAFVGKFMNRVIERQDKRVVVTQRPKASVYKSGEKLLRGDGPIILYRRLRDEMKQQSTGGNS